MPGLNTCSIRKRPTSAAADEALVFQAGAFQDRAGDVIIKLRSEQFAQQVVVVITGVEGDVDLGGPVGLIAAGGHLQQLVFLDEFPPAAVEVLVGIFIHALFEAEHHLGPAAENHLLQAQGVAAGRGRYARPRRP